MEQKPIYKAGNGRYQFDALDILRQARGLPTTEGHVVLTKDFARFLEGELTRLYAAVDVGEAVLDSLLSGTETTPIINQTVIDFMDALGLTIPAPKGEPV